MHSNMAATRRSTPTSDGPATGSRRVLAESDRAPLVLLVDDHEDARVMYEEGLEHARLRVAHATDGDHALLKIMSLLPDVVVMDLAMPIVDGWEATARIKTHPKTKHIPVIVLTGQVTESALTRAVEAGADAVLTKPCTPDALVAVIRGLLRN